MSDGPALPQGRNPSELPQNGSHTTGPLSEQKDMDRLYNGEAVYLDSEIDGVTHEMKVNLFQNTVIVTEFFEAGEGLDSPYAIFIDRQEVPFEPVQPRFGSQAGMPLEKVDCLRFLNHPVTEDSLFEIVDTRTNSCVAWFMIEHLRIKEGRPE